MNVLKLMPNYGYGRKKKTIQMTRPLKGVIDDEASSFVSRSQTRSNSMYYVGISNFRQTPRERM